MTRDETKTMYETYYDNQREYNESNITRLDDLTDEDFYKSEQYYEYVFPENENIKKKLQKMNI